MRCQSHKPPWGGWQEGLTQLQQLPWDRGVRGKRGGCFEPLSNNLSVEQMEVTGVSTELDTEMEMKLTKE